MNSVGIDIGKFSVKLAEAQPTNRSYKIIRYAEFPISQDPSHDSDIAILDILRNIQQQYADSGAHFTFSVSHSSVAFRRLQFPFKERHKILKSLAFELEDETPFDIESSIFDARISRYVGSMADVLACACPKHTVLELNQRAKDAGIEIDKISVDSAALCNLFEEWREAPLQIDGPDTSDDEEAHPAPPETGVAEVVLDLGHQTSSVNVIKDGALLESHVLDWGGQDVAEAIAKKYKLHYVESLKELKSKSFVLLQNEGATQDQMAFSDVIKSAIGLLAQQLQLILIDLRAAYRVEVKQILLMGGASQIKNLGPYLTQHLEVPVNRVRTVARHPNIDFKEGQQSELACATAMGLAIEGLKKPKNPGFNLLQGDLAKQGQHLKQFWDKWNHAIVVACALFVVFTSHALVRGALAERLADKTNQSLKEVAKKFNIKSNTIAINRHIKDMKRQRKNEVIVQSLQNVTSALDILRDVSLKTPGKNKVDLNVRKVVIDATRVRIEGDVAKASMLPLLQKAFAGVASNRKANKTETKLAAPQGRSAFGYEFRVERTED